METQFKIPAGYICWCHVCGRAPFNQETRVDGKWVAGVGLKSWEEIHAHDDIYHNYRKPYRVAQVAAPTDGRKRNAIVSSFLSSEATHLIFHEPPTLVGPMFTDDLDGSSAEC